MFTEYLLACQHSCKFVLSVTAVCNKSDTEYILTLSYSLVVISWSVILQVQFSTYDPNSILWCLSRVSKYTICQEPIHLVDSFICKSYFTCSILLPIKYISFHVHKYIKSHSCGLKYMAFFKSIVGKGTMITASEPMTVISYYFGWERGLK